MKLKSGPSGFRALGLATEHPYSLSLSSVVYGLRRSAFCDFKLELAIIAQPFPNVRLNAL